MKKLDLHIHTIATQSDAGFEFNMEVLKKYVEERKIDAIAITNHNMFDGDQYKEISRELGNVVVFPGVEINIKGSNGIGKGHLILVSKIEKLEQFMDCCKLVSEKIVNENESITIEELKNIFVDFSDYLVIPHYDKSPEIDKRNLEKLREDIICGEVNSVKKFIYCQKNKDALTPVYFSDFRAAEDNKVLPLRQTYFDIEELTIDAIKLCLKDKNKVCLSEKEGHFKFQALPELELSTGLNVIIGERSSGKTYTLEQISNYFENVKYIKQFELLETNPEKAAKEFIEKISRKQNGVSQEYFRLFAEVVKDIKDISLDKDEMNVERYLTTLQKHASEIERADMYSKCKLYSETNYEINNMLDNLDKLIKSVENLLDSTQYKEIVEKIVSRKSLIALHEALIKEFVKEKQKILKKKWVNELLEKIRNKLQEKTAATRISDVNFYGIQLNKSKIEKFNIIAKNIKVEKRISNIDLEGFCVEVRKKPYQKAIELKNHSGRRISFSTAFEEYNDSYKFLQELKRIENLEDSKYFEYFANVEYKILNQYGMEISGGERAEFNLLQEVNDARQYDMLMIDEPESSFDNIFLKNKVNHILKDISKDMPVIIVTHNSTVGASINPDFLVNTKRIIDKNKKVKFELYYGNPTSKILKNASGEEIKNIQVTLDCLEAGESAYQERNQEYEMLRD